jgi:crotonobetainyl-CoA:carnitine CoA-transferase CaiB-like acyl-CoA transferase
MVPQVDVLIHNYRPGAMERLGLSYGDLAQINPRLIYAVAYAFGESGPLSHKGGQDLLAQSYSGLAMNGVEPGAPPRFSATPAVDFSAGMTLAQGILLALFERERSGQGQKVTISLLDTAVAMQALEVSTLRMYGYETNFLRNADVYRSRDGWVTVLSFFRDNPLRLLSQAFEIEDLSLRPEFATIDLQVENKGRIHAIMEGHFKQRTTAECVALLEATDILCAPILSLEETLAHPQLAHNETLTRVAIANQETVELAGNPVRLSRTPMRVEGQVAGHGRDTMAVLREYGFEAEEIDALAEIGAFGEK